MSKRKILIPLTALSLLAIGFVACSSDPVTGNSDEDTGTKIDASSNKDGGTTTETGTAASFAVGGTVTGLAGSNLTLENNGDVVTVGKADKTFVFPKKLAKGAVYSVKVKAQPDGPSQTCVVTAGDGTASADVTTVKVNCTVNTYPIQVTVAGLEGGGLVLQNNGGDDLALSAANPLGPVNGAFAKAIESGKTFEVSVKTQPTKPGQVCVVAGGKGTVVAGAISSVTVNCTTRYVIGGSVTGLAGKDLTIENNAGDTLKINANGSFAFATTAAKGDKYAITVKANPTDAWQTCTITAGTEAGTVASADISSIAIACTTNQYAVSGTITGLKGAGAILQNNGGDNIALAANDTKFAFATKIASGAMYEVKVLTQPGGPTQTCVVTNGGPTKMAGADVSNVTIVCTTNQYKIGGTLSGMLGKGLVLQDNAGDDLKLDANGNFTFATSVASGAPYLVTIKTTSDNAAEQCTITAGTETGTVGAADVTSVVVTCTTCTGKTDANGKCWLLTSLGQSCNTLCASHGGFNAAATTHTGNPICKMFYPGKTDPNRNWQPLECCSTDNNTNWGATGAAPDGAWSFGACYIPCVCNN